jgi:hypothetical protein
MLSRHRLENHLQCRKVSACDLAGAGRGGWLLAAAAMATASSSVVPDAHLRPPEIAMAAEGRPAAANVAAAKDGGRQWWQRRQQIKEEGEAVRIGHVNDDVRPHPRAPEGEGGEDSIVDAGGVGQSPLCPRRLQTSRARGRRGGGRAKGCRDLEEGGGGAWRKEARRRCPLSAHGEDHEQAPCQTRATAWKAGTTGMLNKAGAGVGEQRKETQSDSCVK